jgi:hypothetical protein
MSTSYNGWPASRDPAAIGIKPFVVAGRSFPGGVKGGAVSTVLRYVAAQMHTRVQDLYYGTTDRDDWGYSYRANVNNPSQLSCHSSGTAIDVNATHHPNGRRNTFTYAQVRVIRAILREAGVVRWGGDFTTADEMHFEIHAGSTAVTAAARRLTNPPWWHRDIKLGVVGDDVKVVQRRLGFTGTNVDGKCGPITVGAIKRLQAKLHLTQTGVVNKGMAFYVGTSA